MTGTFPMVTVVDHPLVQHKLTVLRDRRTGTALFRQTLREVGQMLAYETTRDLTLMPVAIETPLEPLRSPVLGQGVCVVSILRAGNGLAEGVLDLIPGVRAGHIGLARDEATLLSREYYLKLPADIGARRTILVDPMLATGGSAVAAVARLHQAGVTDLRFMCLLAAPEGLRRFQAACPAVPVFTAAIDRCLDERGYICPGLGDAGDRFYGTD